MSTVRITSDQEVSEIILNNPHVLLVLEYFNILIPLQEKTVLEICTEKKINAELFLTFVNLYQGAAYVPPINFSFVEIPSIIEFLKNSHTYYTNEMYPVIKQIIKNMYELNTVEEMLLVEQFFNEYFSEVTEHLNYENKVAFPYMMSLYELTVNKTTDNKPTGYSVKEYKEHHSDIEEKLNDLKNLLIKYLPQRNDQPLRRKLFFNLAELEYDLEIHAKIEDLILIPLVEQMERHLRSLK